MSPAQGPKPLSQGWQSETWESHWLDLPEGFWILAPCSASSSLVLALPAVAGPLLGRTLLPLLLSTAYGFQRGSCFKPNFTVGLTEAKGGQTIRLRSLNKWLRLNLNPRRCPFPALAVPARPDGLLNAASRSSTFSLPHCSPLWASECRTLKVRVIWICRVQVILFNDMDLQERV